MALRDRRLNLRLTSDVMARLRAAADQYSGVSVNDLVLFILDGFLKQDPLPPITIKPTPKGRRKKKLISRKRQASGQGKRPGFSDL
jgi:hypothetical protein